MQLLPVCSMFAIVIGSAILHGQWTGRWATSGSETGRPVELDRVPMNIKEWTGEDLALDGQPLPGSVAHLVRRYTNRSSGQTVTVSIVAGRPAQIAVHTPDMCFVGTGGFELLNQPAKYSLAKD